jgi:hypothetical protein
MPAGSEGTEGRDQGAAPTGRQQADPVSLPTFWSACIRLLEPPVFFSVIILGGVSFALGMEIFRSGMLGSMSNPGYARGLITYLYAVVTIGTAVVLVVSALLGSEKVKQDDGRQILALLLGVFGTIVGFYFGNAAADTSWKSGATGLRLTPPLVSETDAVSGERISVTAAVSGGVPPYQFGTSFEQDQSPAYTHPVGSDGWIVADVEIPPVTAAGPLQLNLGVKDAAGAVLTASRILNIRPTE